jgi:hypothetical protein
MRLSTWQLSLSTLASVTALALAAPASAAPGLSSGPDAAGRVVLRMHGMDGTVRTQSVQDMAAVGEVVCDAALENPHWSPPQRAGSVLFKTRISCHGDGPPVVQFRLAGSLGSIGGGPGPRPPQGPPVPRASSDQTQPVTVNGGPQTFYTPLEGPGQPKVRGSAWYQGDVTGQMVAPVTNGPAHASTNRVYVATP